jgi:hypothetical protein
MGKIRESQRRASVRQGRPPFEGIGPCNLYVNGRAREMAVDRRSTAAEPHRGGQHNKTPMLGTVCPKKKVHKSSTHGQRCPKRADQPKKASPVEISAEIRWGRRRGVFGRAFAESESALPPAIARIGAAVLRGSFYRRTTHYRSF